MTAPAQTTPDAQAIAARLEEALAYAEQIPDLTAQLRRVQAYLVAAGVDYQAVAAGRIVWPAKQPQ